MLARRTNGALWAWGQNSSGQLGTGNTTQQASPVQAGTDTDWDLVEAGGNHSAALKTSKVLYGSGTNNVGQSATGSSGVNILSFTAGGLNSRYPYLPALGGNSATLILPAACYNTDTKGYNVFLHPVDQTRQLFALHPMDNTGTFTVVYDSSRNTNSSPLVQSDATHASSLMGRLMTVTYSGTIGTGLRVRYYYSQTDSTNTINALNTWMAVHPGASRKWQWIKYEGDAATMAASQSASDFSGAYTVLTPDSSGIESGVRFVEFWNLTSLSTFGAIASATAPLNDPVAQCWKQVSVGWRHTLALKEDGSLWAWGAWVSGSLGIGTTGLGSKPVPIPVGTATDWVHIYAGNYTSYGIKQDGSLWAWGSNSSGQLGIGNTVQQNSPVRVGTANNWAKVWTSANSGSSFGLKTDGTLWGWGSNAQGQLGIGNTTTQLSPVQIGTDADWATFGQGSSHAFAIKSNGTLWAWGQNDNGQLGIGNTTNQLIPVQVGTDADWASVVGGYSHTAALKKNGTLWIWGYDLRTVPSTIYNVSPLQLESDADWISIIASGTSLFALKSDNTLWAIGGNSSGVLGDGTTTNRATLVQVGTDNDWIAATGGVNSVLALKANKSLWAWGSNDQQQLGINRPANGVYSSPQLTGSSNYAPALTPLSGGGSAILFPACNADFDGYYAYRHPNAVWRKLFAIHPQGNDVSFIVTYDSSRNTNTTPMLQSDATGITSLMGRLVTITYNGTIGTGVRVRFYYSATDSTNASNALNTWISSHPGTIKQWQWIKYEGDAATMAANQIADGFTGTYTKLWPDSSGIENGVSFVEFWNITDFSTFGAVAFANTGNVALPITLSSFTARLTDNCNSVKLDWVTLSEQSSRDFTIQRSANGRSWTDIATISAAGNSDLRLDYSYTDNEPKRENTYYYRLQMNDLDGSYKNSRIVTVKLDCGTGKYFIYPNPVNTFVTVQVPAGGAQKVLSVYNNTGQRIEQTSVPPGAVETISTTHWGKGIYMIIITEGRKQVYAEKIVKQ